MRASASAEERSGHWPLLRITGNTAGQRCAYPAVQRMTHVPAGTYQLQVRKTGYRRNDPLSLYIDMGIGPTLW